MKKRRLNKCPFCGEWVWSMQRYGKYTFILLSNGKRAHKHCYEEQVKKKPRKEEYRKKTKVEERRKVIVGLEKGLPTIKAEKEKKYEYK